MSEFPLKPIKRIIKKYYNGEVSNETVTFVRDILILFNEFITKKAVEEFHITNQIRKDSGLPSLKRLDKLPFKLLWERIFKLINDKNFGEIGNNKDILFRQDGAK